MSFAEKTSKTFTYADYITWPDEERWEIIGGEAYNMTPAPSVSHQSVVSRSGASLRCGGWGIY